MLKCLSILSLLAAVGSGIFLSIFLHIVPEIPHEDEEFWWGQGAKPQQGDDNSVRDFKIDFNAAVISDLKNRLNNRRQFTKTLEGINSEYGMNINYLEKVLTYWTEKYDFKERAELLNRFPHFKTTIQGLDIHFIRVKPVVNATTKILPLLMLHGWPSSSKEFDKVIPILTTQKTGYDFVFEVIAADLPGFGFSEATNKVGLSPVKIAVLMRNLMRRLGFQKFYVQGGDWGAQCAAHMATLYPDDILGLHSNMMHSSRAISRVKFLVGSLFPSLIEEDRKHLERIYPLRNYFSYLIRESGYFHLQATKPDTVGVALIDSPAGMASYVIEKMAICSNSDQLHTPHGGLENLDLEDVLDTLTIIWVNNCIVTSMRLYAEHFGKQSTDTAILQRIPTAVPAAVIKFRYEVIYQPDWILVDKFPNLVHSTTVDYGGHFAAMQTPQALADDIFAATEEFLIFNNKKLIL